MTRRRLEGGREWGYELKKERLFQKFLRIFLLVFTIKSQPQLIHNYQSTSSYLWVAIITMYPSEKVRGKSEGIIMTRKVFGGKWLKKVYFKCFY